jgi:zinc protease
MKRHLFLLLSVFFVSILSIDAQVTNTPIPVDPNVKIGVLPNGLKYYIKHNEKPENKVELRLVVNAGAILEDDDQQGLAHFMEHMCFNGLEHFPGNELVHYLQSIGVGFGNDLNAYTGFDQTVYILPVPSDDKEKLDKAFTVIADWAGGALLTDEEIDKERGVILSESRLGKGSDDRMMKIWLPLMLNGSKYSNRLPIGKDSIIESFKYETIRRFYRDWYRPNLQAVVVVGDMSVEDAEKLIIEKFSDHKNPSPVRNRQEFFEVKPFQASQAVVVSDPEADMTYVNIVGSSRKSKPTVTQADYLDDVVEQLAYNMLYSRLDELVNSANPPFIYAYAYNGGWARGYESFTAAAACSPEGIKPAIQNLVIECLRVKEFGFTEQELERAKAAILSRYEKQYNERDKTESGRITREYVNNYLDNEPIPGIEWEYKFVKEHLKDITLANFDEVRNNINIDNKYFCYVTTKTSGNLPKNEELKAWVDEAMKTKVTPYTEKKIASSLLKSEPKSGSIVSSTKNEKLGTTTYTLSNGAIVCIKPTTFKNDEIVFKGSKFGGYSTYEGKDYQSAQFSNNVVEEMGYGEFSATDLNKFLSGKDVKVIPVVDDYTENISGNCGVKDMETMFQLIYLKSTSPRKDMEAFQSFVTRSKQQLMLAKQSPENLFADSLYNTLYQGNPRAHLINSPADYDKINIDNAIAFYLERIGNPKGMYFTFVGSFTEGQIKPLIEKYIGGIPSGDSESKYKSMGMAVQPGIKSFTLRKGSEQKAMLMHYYTKSTSFNADDNFVLAQLNQIINNRIIDTIREKMGAIYGGGFYGSVKKYPNEELFMRSYFPCSPENIDAVNETFLRLVEETKIDGNITISDLERVRQPALETYKVNIQKNQYWMNNLQYAWLNQTDPERILAYEKNLNDITPAKLAEIARKYFTGQNIFTGSWLPESK